jgi:myo-inositol-1(or 4)-monophosphatase
MTHFWATEATGLTLTRKADGSPVTEADRASEAVLVAGLRAAWPSDGIVGEEGGAHTGDGVNRWVVDPIDGTASFVEGLCHWGPTVARLDAAGVQAGALWLPRCRDYFFVERNTGLFVNGRSAPLLGGGRVSRGAVMYIPSKLHRFLRLDWPGKARNLGSHAAHLFRVATGAAQAVLIGPGWSVWDVAAGCAAVEIAGGRVAMLSGGGRLDPLADEGAAFVAGTEAVVEHLLRDGTLQPR